MSLSRKKTKTKNTSKFSLGDKDSAIVLRENGEVEVITPEFEAGAGLEAPESVVMVSALAVAMLNEELTQQILSNFTSYIDQEEKNIKSLN